MARLLRPPPLALYAHFPWCVRKCPYCDFNSHALARDQGGLPESDYVDALLADLDHELEDRGALLAARPVISVFLGGGTPSLFAPASIGRFLAGLRARLAVAADLEVTLEANPGTVEHARFTGYREAGVTRISLGVQSFDDARLATLGRIHGGDEARRAATEVQAAGFATFNLDLMYALPQQDAAGALADVTTALALGAPHVSHYELTLEPNTLFHAKPPAGLPDDESAWALQTAAHAALRAGGLEQYEVSAWARDAGQRCRHNLNYWEFGDYVGVGAGAHGKLTAADGTVWRTERDKHPTRYLERAAKGAAASARCIEADALPFEFMLNALRLSDGIARARFEERTGLPWRAIAERVDALQRRGLLAADPERLRASALGFRRMNDLLLEFLPDAAGAVA
jgi:putative oxygen-independent coproporphyrinogen III oxidase